MGQQSDYGTGDKPGSCTTEKAMTPTPWDETTAPIRAWAIHQPSQLSTDINALPTYHHGTCGWELLVQHHQNMFKITETKSSKLNEPLSKKGNSADLSLSDLSNIDNSLRNPVTAMTNCCCTNSYGRAHVKGDKHEFCYLVITQSLHSQSTH